MLNILKCPRCHISLDQVFYESASVQLCPNCQGVLLGEATLSRIISREEVGFSQEIICKAHKYQEENKKIRRFKNTLIRTIDVLHCPRCYSRKAGMLRRFYSIMYRIEIDKCSVCDIVWFDKDELEMLQCLIEEAKGSAQI